MGMSERSMLVAAMVGVLAAVGAAQVSVTPPKGSAAAADNQPAIPVRVDQTLTINALAGFVNGSPVFVNDLLRPIDGQLRQIAAQSQTLTDFQRNARAAIHAQMQNYFFELMFSTKAKAGLTDQELQQVDIFMNRVQRDMLAKFGGSRALADQAKKAEGSSVDKELAADRRSVIIELYQRREIMPKVFVTRDMIMDAYNHDPKRWQVEPEVELFTISIPVSRWLRAPTTDGSLGKPIQNPTAAQVKDAEAHALATADEIETKLKKGADFARLAEDYSADNRANSGGFYPSVKRGSMKDQALEDYVFTLPANAVGKPQLHRDPDPTKELVMIVKVGKKQEARKISFEEAQNQLAEELTQKQTTALRNEMLLKMEQTTPVENESKMEDAAVDAAVARYAYGQ